MSNEYLSFGTSPVQFSITNADTDTALVRDNFQPFSFFEYLQYTQQSTTPELFSQGYSSYLHDWYGTKDVVPAQQADEIRLRYVNLLRDIAVNYTTADEKRFLSSIDYDDPSDLAVAIPFYAAKLKEICLLYARKRDTFKFKIESVKVKGSTFSIERAIYDNIIDYLYSSGSNEGTAFTGSLSAVIDNLKIDVVEYFDTYSDYFDIDPDAAVFDLTGVDELRKKFITSNTNILSANIFIDFEKAISDQITNTPFYLKEIGRGLLINPSKLTNQIINTSSCVQAGLAALLNSNAAALSAGYDLKKKLIEKYAGTDFYYLSTNSISQFVTGSLFNASKPSANLSNKRFISTASIPENALADVKELGKFFKPDKLGIIQLSDTSKHFNVNASKLEGDKIYVFPDPQVYGNVTNLRYSNIEYPFIHVVDNTANTKGLDSGSIYGNIKSNEYLQNFYAYFSEPVYINTQNFNVSSFDAALMRVFNRGSFTHFSQDVHGNEYAIIKPITRYNRVVTDESLPIAQCITLDGHTFFDDFEGFSFNYSTTGTNFDGSIRTGLTARTVSTTDFTLSGSFVLSGSPTTCYFREYIPFIDCSAANRYVISIRDCGQFTASDNSLLPDVSSDSPSWSVVSDVYYSTLYDAGISATNVMVPGGLYATLTAVPALSSSLFELLDSQRFNTTGIELTDYNYGNDTNNFVSVVNPGCSTVLQTDQTVGDETINDINALAGAVLIKNIVTNTVDTLSATLFPTFSKYSSNVRDELYGNGVVGMNIFYDSIVITTANYIVFDKIRYDTGVFSKPGTRNNYIVIDNGETAGTSNTFFIEKDESVWIAQVSLLQNSLSASNSKTIYPTVWKYDISSNKLVRKFPNTVNSSLSSLFAVAMTNINITSIDDVKLTYAALNDKFSITWVGRDLNNMCYIFNAWFNYIGDEIVFDSDQVVVFSPSTGAQTKNFATHLSGQTNTQLVSSVNVNISYSNNTIFFN